MQSDFKTVLFLCTGNYYRSRFAEELFNFHAESRNLSWRAVSRGIADTITIERNPGPISKNTLEELAKRNVPVRGSQRYPIKAVNDDFLTAHRVIALYGPEHRPMLAANYPEITTPVDFWDVADGDIAEPINACLLAEERVLGLIDELVDRF